MQTLFNRVCELVRGAQHILLITDERIDGDTIGSTLGLFHVLTKADKKVTVFSPKQLNKELAYLPGVNNIHRDANIFRDESIDLAIVCDAAEGSFLRTLTPMLTKNIPLVSFDHHSDNPRYAQINIVDGTAASTCDLVWRFVKYCGLPVNRDAARCFLTGICTDTMMFKNPNTTPVSIESAAELMRYGADFREVVTNNLLNQSMAALKLWGIAMERLTSNPEFDGVATFITEADMQELGATESDAGGISNFLNGLLDDSYDIITVFRETSDNAVKGGVRSRHSNVASLLAKRYPGLGAGGHPLAAGVKIPNARLIQKEGAWSVAQIDDAHKASNV